jgi:hypothetical protein
MSLTITVNGGGTFTASMEEGPVSFTASLAAVGPQGPAGANGAPGQGVPVGGTTGQVLAKASGTDYDTAWVAANPFNQSLNTTDTVSFDEVRIPSPDNHAKLDEYMWRPFSIAHGDLGIEYRGDKVLFANETEQFTALPNGTADGYIVIWNAANSTYVSSPNETRALFMLGTNKTGTTIAKGKAVYVSGATGNHPEITLAQANSELASSRTIGITAEAIANNAEGRVIVSGRLENVNTNGFTAGDTLFLSATTAGGFTTTFPTQPNHGVLLGYVTRANANNGVIEVVVKNYQELAEQSDVLLTSKANNDLLSYESSSGLWKNKSFSTLGLLTSATAASTYAPIASPTFTGTVTIPAGASISGFAPLASPALTGTPTAPTAAAATNTTQIATTAFVQQEVPAASTTVAGKVELATEAEAATGTSTTLAVTPAGLAGVVDAQRVNIQTFGSSTTSGTFTWNKPAGARLVQVRMIGAGGGGSSGACRTTTSNRVGGGAGGGGSSSIFLLPASELADTVSVVVGAGGTGGAGSAVSGAGLVSGNGGGSTQFGNYRVFNGSGGSGASGGGGFAGIVFNLVNTTTATSGGAGASGAGSSATGHTSGQFVPTGGGGGAGQLANVTTTTAGGNGGSRTNGTVPSAYLNTLAGGAGGTTGNGTNGTDQDVPFASGTGGGGGAYVTAQATGNGGNGGWPGGGGGGGAGSDAGFKSGDGGNGAHGVVIVITYF